VSIAVMSLLLISVVGIFDVLLQVFIFTCRQSHKFINNSVLLCSIALSLCQQWVDIRHSLLEAGTQTGGEMPKQARKQQLN